MSDDETYIMETKDLVADPVHQYASENGYDLLDFCLEHLGDGMGEAGDEMEEEEFQVSDKLRSQKKTYWYMGSRLPKVMPGRWQLSNQKKLSTLKGSRSIQPRLMRLVIGWTLMMMMVLSPRKTFWRSSGIV